MRQSANEYTATGRLWNGFDYIRQAWAVNGIWQRCGHPKEMDCRCWGKVHKGENTPEKGDQNESESHKHYEYIMAVGRKG